MVEEKPVKIIFHGYLKKLCPRELMFSGKTVMEILTGVSNQVKELRPVLGQKRHQVSVKGFQTVEELNAPIQEGITELHIVPAMIGAKGGFFRIVVGVALIAFAVFNPAFVALGGMVTASSIFGFGVSLILGGLLEMLSPAPKIDRTGNTESDPEASKYLGAAKNTTKIGTRIALAYGKVRVGGHYLSFDIQAKDVALT